MQLTIETGHGMYDVLPYRDADEGPAGAVLSVYHDGGALVGFVSAGQDGYVAHYTLGSVIGTARYATGQEAAAVVAGEDLLEY